MSESVDPRAAGTPEQPASQGQSRSVVESADELRARVAALEEENAALRSTENVSPATSRSRGRAVAAVAMIVVGVLMAPVAVVCGWANWMLTDTDRFVATYAPLAHSPAVQSYVVDQAMDAIDAKVNLDELANAVVEGIIALGTGPRVTAALRTLEGSLVDSLRSQIRSGVTDFVASDRFADAWAQSLRIAHRQLIGTLSGDPSAIAEIGPDGTLGIPLEPIVEQVKTRLVDQGVTIAKRIPHVDKTIVLVQSNQLPMVQTAYSLVVGLGTWLPWVVLALLAGGVIVANRRHRALLWGAVGFALAMAVLAVAFAVGRIVLLTAVPPSVLPGPVAGLFYDTATDGMRSTATAAMVLGVAVALVAWLSGPFRTPTRLRGLYGDGLTRLRSGAEEHGVTTGRVGEWVYRRRLLLFAVIAVVAGIVIVANTPVTVALIGWTALWSVVAVIVVTLVERPPVSVRVSAQDG